MPSSMHPSQLRRWIMSSPPLEWSISRLRDVLIAALKAGPVPQHIAFVMDGNRRFARSHRIERVEGHNLGFEALAKILEVCYRAGVKVVTVYAFSIENFKRSKYEVDALMDMAKVKMSQLSQHGDLLDRYGASVRILGRRELVKEDVLEAMDRAVEMTSRNGDAILNICFPYTSRDEITTSIRNTVIDYSTPLERSKLATSNNARRPFSETHISQNIRTQSPEIDLPTQDPSDPSSETPNTRYDKTTDDAAYDSPSSFSSSTTLHQPVESSKPSTTVDPYTTYPPNSDQFLFLNPEAITAQTLSDHMFTAKDPPVDLLIRTSGVERLSDFMLWQCHQNTEIVFLDVLWPEFDLWSFLPVLWEWQWRMRKQGNRADDGEEEVENDEVLADALAVNGNGSKIKSI